MKDSLFSCATRTLERISKNPLVEESITFNRVNPVWDRFPTPLSVICPVRLQTNIAYRDNFSKHPIAPETGSPTCMRTRFVQYSDLKLQTKSDYSASLPFQRCPCASQAIESLRGHPSISYIWLNSLTFNHITILLKKKQKSQKYIYTNTNNQSSI